MKPTIRKVVDNDMCVGCGACAVATRGAIEMRRGRHGFYVAELAHAADDVLAAASRVCPFAHEAADEDAIAARVIEDMPFSDPRLGKYLSIHAGRVAADAYLNDSSSGGMTSWLAGRLLEEGLVDGVIHVGRGDDELFSYSVSRSLDEIRTRRKSAYYSTSFAAAVEAIRGDGLRYAFIGVPCFVRAARLACLEDPALARQLRYFIGLVCGHLKSAAFAEFLAWQCGVAPDEVKAVDFRVKAPGRDAGRYDFAVQRKGASDWITRPTFTLQGGNWGHGMFQLNACNYCDDIFAETADVVFGDAWLPEYRADWRGTNIALTRNATIARLLAEGRQRGELVLDALAPERAAESQGGNFRHRREGLAVRLADDRRAGRWVPLKRVAPGSVPLGRRRKALVRQRRAISEASHRLFAEARAAASLEQFVAAVQPLVARYDRLNGPGLLARLRARLRRLLRPGAKH